MSASFLLAQITDLHMGPVPFPGLWHANPKRVLGFANWHGKRRNSHLTETLDAIVADIAAQRPDHIAVTGDLVNIGLPHEYDAAARWLARLGPPERVSVIPGNHDIYTTVGSDPGSARWRPWMGGQPSGVEPAWRYPADFPYVKRIGGVALIGINSAIPTPPIVAVGEVGIVQRKRLAACLDSHGREGVMRVVMIHHPPLPGLAHPQKALNDAVEFTAVLERHGAELVIYGHNHKAKISHMAGPAGAIPVVGAPSASLGKPYKSDTLARYHLFKIVAGAPVELVARGLDVPQGPVVEIERHTL